MRHHGPNREDKDKEQAKPDRVETEMIALSQQVHEIYGANLPAKKDGRPVKLDKYQKEALYTETLASIGALYCTQKPYFAKKVHRESKLPIPEEIKNAAEIVKKNGHNIFEIIDHLLIANAVGALSAVGSVSSLYPAASKEAANEYRKALRDINIELLRPENVNSEKMLNIKAEAQEVSAVLFTHQSGIFQFFAKADYKFMPRNGHVLMLAPDLTIGKSIAFAVGDVKMTIVSEDFWTTEVFAAIGSVPGRKGKKPNLTTHGYSVTRVADKLDDSYKVVHVNGRLFENTLGLATVLSNIAKKMKVGSTMIFDFDSWPQGRQTAVKTISTFENLINRHGFEPEIKLGRCAYTQTESPLGKIFHPVAYGEKDHLIFTKKDSADKNNSIKTLKKGLTLLEGLAKLKDGTTFDIWAASLGTIDSLKMLESLDLGELMAAFTPNLLKVADGVDANAMKEASEHLKRGNIEGFVEEYQNSQRHINAKDIGKFKRP